MIGLPTNVASRMSSRSMPTCRATSATRSLIAGAHGVGHLLRRRPGSSSRRRRGSSGLRRSGSAGSSRPAEATTSPLDEIAQMRGDRRRADVDGDAVDALVEARPDGDDLRCRRARRRSPSSRPGAAPAAAAAARAGRRRARSAATRTRAPPRGAAGRRRGRACRAAALRRSAAARRGSSSMSCASAPLRTTWRCTWLSGGTSMTTSPWTCVEQDSRRPGASGCAASCTRCSTAPSGDRFAARERHAVLGELALGQQRPGSGRRSRARRRPNRCRRRACARPAAAACRAGSARACPRA